MASVYIRNNGRAEIQFKAADGMRRTIRLGKMSKRDAERLGHRIEELNAAAMAGESLPPKLARWVSELSPALADKLADATLIPRRRELALQGVIDGYIARRIDVKESSRKVWTRTRKHLLACFDSNRNLRTSPAATRGTSDRICSQPDSPRVPSAKCVRLRIRSLVMPLIGS